MSESDKTAYERGKKFKKKMEKLGFIRIHPWCHEDDRERALKYMERLKKQRLKDIDGG